MGQRLFRQNQLPLSRDPKRIDFIVQHDLCLTAFLGQKACVIDQMRALRVCLKGAVILSAHGIASKRSSSVSNEKSEKKQAHQDCASISNRDV